MLRRVRPPPPLLILISVGVDTKNNTTMTQLQKAMLKDIQQCENDGLGMGYSEFDGVGLTPSEKGVLGSLVAEGYVYNSATGWEDSDAMFCSTSKAPRLID